MTTKNLSQSALCLSKFEQNKESSISTSVSDINWHLPFQIWTVLLIIPYPVDNYKSFCGLCIKDHQGLNPSVLLSVQASEGRFLPCYEMQKRNWASQVVKEHDVKFRDCV
jgi:hypothetical protein